MIGGCTLPSDGGASIGALLVGFYEDGRARLRRQGRLRLQRAPARRPAAAPGGAAAEDVARSPTSPPSCGGARSWVEPDLVAQVEFTEWTDEGRMRQPVFLGLRDDRDARHVVRERPGTVEGGGVDTVAAGRPWEALRQPRDAHARRERRGGRRPPRRAPDPPGPRLLPRPRLHQAGPRALLRVDRRRGAAASRRPPAHARALPGRDRRRDLLPEAPGLLDAARRCGASPSRAKPRSTSTWTRCPASWRSRRPGSSRSIPGTRGWRGSSSRTR